MGWAVFQGRAQMITDHQLFFFIWPKCRVHACGQGGGGIRKTKKKLNTPLSVEGKNVAKRFGCLFSHSGYSRLLANGSPDILVSSDAEYPALFISVIKYPHCTVPSLYGAADLGVPCL